MIAKRLKQLRGEAGLSQQSLGDKLGVSQQTVAGWEAGRTAPNRRYVARLVEIFGVTSDYFLGISDNRTGAGADGLPAPDYAYLHMARILRDEGITTEDLQTLLQARDVFLRLNR
ncbi:MAG: helix-turn-helix domain-containing protein [Oscillospiraceae bacterium]|nr:helix-turn-helix domain-containing protein [Oscillospiraceae bacterium]